MPVDKGVPRGPVPSECTLTPAECQTTTWLRPISSSDPFRRKKRSGRRRGAVLILPPFCIGRVVNFEKCNNESLQERVERAEKSGTRSKLLLSIGKLTVNYGARKE
ncbi:uncharacterized protein V6R79_021727 [Siganus canaliculatus]